MNPTGRNTRARCDQDEIQDGTEIIPWLRQHTFLQLLLLLPQPPSCCILLLCIWAAASNFTPFEMRAQCRQARFPPFCKPRAIRSPVLLLLLLLLPGCLVWNVSQRSNSKMWLTDWVYAGGKWLPRFRHSLNSLSYADKFPLDLVPS